MENVTLNPIQLAKSDMLWVKLSAVVKAIAGVEQYSAAWAAAIWIAFRALSEHVASLSVADQDGNIDNRVSAPLEDVYVPAYWADDILHNWFNRGVSYVQRMGHKHRTNEDSCSCPAGTIRCHNGPLGLALATIAYGADGQLVETEVVVLPLIDKIDNTDLRLAQQVRLLDFATQELSKLPAKDTQTQHLLSSIYVLLNAAGNSCINAARRLFYSRQYRQAELLLMVCKDANLLDSEDGEDDELLALCWCKLGKCPQETLQYYREGYYARRRQLESFLKHEGQIT